MEKVSSQKVLGIGNYTAHWVGKSLQVRLTATGAMPCWNYVAQLEPRPEDVEPPNWNLVFYTQDVCLTAVRPFDVNAVMANTTGATHINVTDAVGVHQVEIEHAEPSSVKGSLTETAADRDEFVVYAKLPAPKKGHHGCIVVPADAIVTAIHYRAFGPASKAECEAFVANNCGTDADLRGGEIPWPLLK